MQRRERRINVQRLYPKDSPTGGTSLPCPVGANGWLFTSDVMLNF